jgi:hypothetical protein
MRHISRGTEYAARLAEVIHQAVMSGDWKGEAEIKEELRILTNELKRLREELRGKPAPAHPSSPRTLSAGPNVPAKPPPEPDQNSGR